VGADAEEYFGAKDRRTQISEVKESRITVQGATLRFRPSQRRSIVSDSLQTFFVASYENPEEGLRPMQRWNHQGRFVALPKRNDGGNEGASSAHFS